MLTPEPKLLLARRQPRTGRSPVVHSPPRQRTARTRGLLKIRRKEYSMRRTIAVVVLAGVTLLLTTSSAMAHHAFGSEFDADKPVKLKGTVTRMEWVNPHSWIHIDVKKPDGTVEEWMVEGGTPNTLLRRGFTKTSLLPGTEILVDGFQSKDGSHKANGRDLTLPDGRALFFGSSGTGAPGESKDSNP
jgi:hypothetical protein